MGTAATSEGDEGQLGGEVKVGSGKHDDECEAVFNRVHREDTPSPVLLIVVEK